MDSLKVDPRKARVLLTTILSEKNKEYMTSIDKVHSVSKGNLESVYKMMISYSRTYEELKRLTTSIMGDITLPIPGLPFADVIRANLYELNLQNPSVTFDDMFELNPKQRELVKKSIALPRITSWIMQCMKEGNFDDLAKQAYHKLLQEYNVSPTEWKNTAIDFYYPQVEL